LTGEALQLDLTTSLIESPPNAQVDPVFLEPINWLTVD
jgi:hypothetical protein